MVSESLPSSDDKENISIPMVIDEGNNNNIKNSNSKFTTTTSNNDFNDKSTNKKQLIDRNNDNTNTNYDNDNNQNVIEIDDDDDYEVIHVKEDSQQPSNTESVIDGDEDGDEFEVIHINQNSQNSYADNIAQRDHDDNDDDDGSDISNDDSSEDVIVIDDDSPNTHPNSIPAATQFKSIAKKYMKPIPDYPVKDEIYNVWEIKDWSSLLDDKIRGPTFTCGEFNWNILLFPRGNSGNGSISIYMEPHPIDETKINDDWHVCAQFTLDIWNPISPDSHIVSGSSHRFTKSETDWGFSSFIDMKQMLAIQKNHKHPILENNQLNITGYIKIIDDSSTGVLWHSFLDYDSKKNTEFVGLNNQGATCYLNSLLQSYYTTKSFRKLVYQIPTDVNNNNSNKNNVSVPLALQRIFYLLSTSNDPVGTLELTKSFGWDSSEAFTQHDVQELNRILMDKLETAMKGTKIENKLNDIFVGKMKSFIKCVNVPYESSRVEDFWDIQLNVKGFKNLQQAFKNYIEIEMLEGENKYQAGDEYGYQDAKKGVVFESFPPVLHLQLKRFEYDFMIDDLVKIDDLYEFPDKIDLKPYLDDEISEDVKNQNWNYKLHGVLVHQGSISNGHYYAMIKPNSNNDTWLRFDDDKVWKATKTQVFQENFGAAELPSEILSKMSRPEQNEYLIRRATSAYMLVYYRESELEEILPIDDSKIHDFIPTHIPQQIKDEQEQLEKLEKMKQEALFYINVKIATASNFNSYNGFDLYPDPTIVKFYDYNVFDEKSHPISLKVKKHDKFTTLYKSVAKELGYIKNDDDLNLIEGNESKEKPEEIIDVDAETDEDLSKYPFRLTMVNHRNNHTNRADIPVPKEFENLTIYQIYNKCFNKKYDEMVFYVEEISKELNTIKELNSDKVEEISPENFEFGRIYSKINENEQIPITLNSIPFKFKNIDEGSFSSQIFLKYFDIVTNEVRGLTHVIVSKDDNISSLIKPVNKLLGFPQDTQLEFFEELSQIKIEDIDIDSSFEKNELTNGDIIVIQIKDIENATIDKKIKSIKDYYRFLLTRLRIHVKPFKAHNEDEDSDFVADDETPEVISQNNQEIETINKTGNVQEAKEIEIAKEISKSFDLWISTQYDYKELSTELAKKIDNDIKPENLRIFIVNNQGIRYPLKSSQTLSQFFPKLVSVSSITNFEYEILNITLKEYENMKSIKIYWLNSILQYQLFDLLMPKSSTARDLINKLINKLNIPSNQLNNILLWAGLDHKYVELIKFDRTIESINDSFELYTGFFPADVEILTQHDLFKRFIDKPTIPEEIEDEFTRNDYLHAKKLSDQLNIIPVYHFYKNVNYQHSIPFIFAVYPDEPFDETKERLRKKLGLGIQAFDKIKFALADSNAKGRYIDHEKLESNLFDQVSHFEANVSLALDHPDRTPRRQNPFDKGISIK